MPDGFPTFNPVNIQTPNLNRAAAIGRQIVGERVGRETQYRNMALQEVQARNQARKRALSEFTFLQKATRSIKLNDREHIKTVANSVRSVSPTTAQALDRMYEENKGGISQKTRDGANRFLGEKIKELGPLVKAEVGGKSAFVRTTDTGVAVVEGVTPPSKAPKEFAPPEIVKLQNALDGLPVGDSRRKSIERRIDFLTEKGPKEFKPPEIIALQDRRDVLLKSPQKDKRKIEELNDAIDKLKAEKPGAIERKKIVLQKAFPEFDDRILTKLATGLIKINRDPDTAQLTLVDITTGEQRSLKDVGVSEPIEIPDKPDTDPTIGPTIFDLSDQITGPGSTVKQGLNVLFGMVGLPIPSKQVARARQFAVQSQMQLVRAESINRRFPVGEINRIREEIKIKPAFWDNPQLLRERIRAIDRSLRIRLENEKKSSVDKKLSSKKRKDSADAVVDIAKFLVRLGNPPTFTNPDDSAFKALVSGEPFYWGDELMFKK